MEVCRRSSGLLLLLGFALLATTLQDVQAEVESEGPSESECRPYIEKALKELEHETAPESSETQDSVEDVPTIEITDDSSHQEGEGDDNETYDEQGQGEDSKESVEGENAPKENVAEQKTEPEKTADKGKEAAIEEKFTENKDDTSTETIDKASGEYENGKHDDGDSIQEDSKETQSAVDDEDSKENESEEKEEESEDKESDEEDDTKREAETDEEQGEQQEESQEQEESQGSAEIQDQTKSQEQQNQEQESQEQTVVDSDSPEQTDIKEEDMKGQQAESQEEQGETQKESREEQDETQEDIKEELGEIQVDQQGQESQELDKSEEAVETPESQKQTESKENNENEAQEESEEKQEDAIDQNGSLEDAASLDDLVRAEEQEESNESEKNEQESSEKEETETKSTNIDSAEAHDGEQSKEGESIETTEPPAGDVESVGDEMQGESSEGDPKQNAEKDDDSKKGGEDGQSDENDEKIIEKRGTVQGDKESGEETSDKGDVEQSTDQFETDEDADKSEEGDAVVEELSLDVEIPSELRSREHVEQLLKLDKEHSEKESIINRVSEMTLKELKKLYENAIKPLEVLYKYRDLSNRHFGDAEIFSKPLILFMGPWSGGKSSIINYLTNIEYNDTALRTGAEPSPAYFNILMHGEEPEVIDGTELAADFTFSGLQKFGQGLEERLKGLKLPIKLLEKVNIVEIPGILEVRKQVSRVFPFNDACQWFIDRADIIFLVYDPSKLDVGPETEAILDQLKGREHQTRIVLNKADQVKPEELLRVQGALIWNISPLMSSPQPPVMYTTSLWSRPYEPWAPVRLLQAQERAFLRDLRSAVDKRIENKIASARRFAVRVRNHAKMVDCYLTTYYNHKSVFGNRKQVADEIVEHPQDYHIYEGLSTLTNISRYDLPDPDVYRDFFKLNPLYEFQQLSATCTYFRGCPINRLDIAIAYDLPELVGTHKKLIENALTEATKQSTSTPSS